MVSSSEKLPSRTFLVLILCQALHSIEEYTFALWDVLASARYVSGLISSDLALGFAIANTVIVAIGAWCYWVPVRLQRSYAPFLVWFWALLEIANSIGHTWFALSSQAYFPGLYTAPLLLATAITMVVQMYRMRDI